jgi:uncharacterized protein
LEPINVGNTEKYGRGIFAIRNIRRGELIEVASVIVIPNDEWYQMRGSVLSNYVFRWGEDKALALGTGSLYNHSFNPNARYYTNIENQSIDFYARRFIAAGDEIVVNYNGDPRDNSPVWFDVIE